MKSTFSNDFSVYGIHREFEGERKTKYHVEANGRWSDSSQKRMDGSKVARTEPDMMVTSCGRSNRTVLCIPRNEKTDDDGKCETETFQVNLWSHYHSKMSDFDRKKRNFL